MTVRIGHKRAAARTWSRVLTLGRGNAAEIDVALDRVTVYLAEHARRGSTDHIHGFGLGEDAIGLLASDLRTLLAVTDPQSWITSTDAGLDCRVPPCLGLCSPRYRHMPRVAELDAPNDEVGRLLQVDTAGHVEDERGAVGKIEWLVGKLLDAVPRVLPEVQRDAGRRAFTGVLESETATFGPDREVGQPPGSSLAPLLPTIDPLGRPAKEERQERQQADLERIPPTHTREVARAALVATRSTEVA